MKRWIFKAERIIRQRNGETLVESIVSLLVLSILLLSVTAMIQTSLRMTASSIEKAKNLQEEIVNPVILTKYSSNEEAKIKFTFEISGAPIEVEHDVLFNEVDGIIAFAPPEDLEVGVEP